MYVFRLTNSFPKILNCLNNTRKWVPKTSPYFARLCTSTKSSGLDVNTNVVKDVILYKYENPRFFRLLNIFAFCQFGFWAYLSYFSFFYLRDVPADKSKDSPWFRRINLGEPKYRYAIGISSFIIGYGILVMSWMYTLRSVRYVVLRKGGNNLTLVTYTPYGENRMMTLGLDKVSCKESRERATSLLPMKVKGHFFHYILDMRGEFKNASLFDHTAGLRRVFK